MDNEQTIVEMLKSDVTIPFGKYKGKHLSFVYATDKQYLYWLLTNTSFKIKEEWLQAIIAVHNEKVEQKEKNDQEFMQRMMEFEALESVGDLTDTNFM